VPPATSLTDGPAEARSFAESVAGVIRRHGPAGSAGWVPGSGLDDPWPELTALLDDLGWESLARDDGLGACAGLGALELGRGLGSIWQVDRLLGGSPVADFGWSFGSSTTPEPGTGILSLLAAIPLAACFLVRRRQRATNR